MLASAKIPGIWAFRTLLKRAGVSYKDALGRQADFHAIRRSLNTHMAQNGVDAHTRKEIMRHSDLRLTLDVYTDRTALPTVAAIEKLPIFALLQENAQIDAHNADSAVHSVAQSGVAKRGAEEVQRARDERREHVLACVDTVSQTGLAASLGFEPRQRDPESLVLPLHHEAPSEKTKDRCASLQVERGRVQNELYAAAIFFASSSISLPSWAAAISRGLPPFATSSRADFSIASTVRSS